MGYRNEDGTWHDSCLDKVHANEPIFVLRGQDRLAPDLIREWARLAEHHSLPQEKLNEALACADAMETWPNRKFPD